MSHPIRTTLRTITPPANEPIALAQAKAYARSYSTWEDAMMGDMITEARQLAEQYTGRILVTSTLLWTIQLRADYMAYTGAVGLGGGFGFGGFGAGSPMGGMYWPERLELPVSPVQGINSITVRGADQTDTVIDPSVYDLDSELDPGLLRLRYYDIIQAYPAVILPLQHVQVSLTAGYGGPEYNEAIPAPILRAIYIMIAYLYRNRGVVNEDTPGVPDVFYTLLDNYRIVSFGVGI